MIICLDVLAGAKYPEIVAKIPAHIGLGFFWDTFGPAKAVIAKEARRRKLIRIQGQWSDTHSFGPGNEQKAINIGKELQKIAAQNPGCRIEYSLYCEHRKPSSYMRPLLDKVQRFCPNVVLVNSPISGGQWVTGYKNEIHHTDKPAGKPQGSFNFSFDGLHCVDADTEKFKSENASADAIFGWVLQFNLKKNHKDKTPRPQRKCKPTTDLCNGILHILENGKRAVKLPNGWLYKAFAEQHHDVDPRANKPVVLGPKGKRFKKVTVGSEVLRESGTTDNRQVWRCSKWGYKMGRVLEVKADGKLIGTVDAGFRENEYRNKA